MSLPSTVIEFLGSGVTLYRYLNARAAMQVLDVSGAELSDRIDTSAGYCSIILSDNPSRRIGSKMARKLESALGLERFDLDRPPVASSVEPLSSAALVLGKALESMPAPKAERIMALVGTLTQDSITEADLDLLLGTAKHLSRRQ